ncbi:hypothetical protein AKJ41_04270 [candidate division MSBL1 archaeon SCGC-AAA259O05]|uniref:CAAX prenyl protease 2/Lysostaphin resistance protein A-like domain-containing protein n=1 Tax=candidate division MSBL1 archaeon SCGC-AAA259O05 TaxID=1698271 RepID=A0A133V1B3_9EURY|nr:hypothetical protein AKJ41_04270 [candidate division MSBL1 archaeon SCGC-AAA259O05]
MGTGKNKEEPIGSEKRKKLKLFLVLVALLLIPTYLIPNNPLFYSTFSEMASNYGFFIFSFVVFPLLILSTFRFGRRIQEERLPTKIVNYLGFERSVSQVAIGLVMGSLTGLITWHLEPDAMIGHSITGSQVITMLLFAPLFEETIFRGFLINQILDVERSKKLKVLAVAASILLFAWGHGKSPVLKVIGGSLYTLLYVWGWGNNLTAAISAHFGGNAVVLLSGFSTFGFRVVLMVLAVTGSAFIPLIFLIWQAENFAQLAVKGFRKISKLHEKRECS